ncbi:transcription factor ETV6 [Ixodes scapularis]|uniref:transcription factor ETV6 n=1 Tax=Ixodes scapularis TaxID=6945 RepID=UPI001C38362E|nr:transcription factor ETV6 [Ixodes scapularis]
MHSFVNYGPCATFQESCQEMSPSSWFGQGSSGLAPSPAAYRGLYALTVRWQQPLPRGDHQRKSHSPCLQEPSLLPRDPRQWSREHVAVWLVHVMAQHQLPAVSPDRFLMNGKALCLMNMEMFVQRVPLGGKLLYKDFQLRLSNVLYN